MQRRRLSTRVTSLLVLAIVVLAVLLRVPFLRDGIYPDEGGMLVVAREWHTGGPYLYGDYFLARPPLIMLFFRLAGDLGGILAVRVLGLGLVAVIVGSAAWAGHSLAARRGAITPAAVSAAFMANPLLGSREVDAETVGLPFGMAATGFLLAAYRTPRGSRARAWLLVGGGALAVCALLAKQNLADALAFGGVLIVAAGLLEKNARRAAVLDLVWFALGIAIPSANHTRSGSRSRCSPQWCGPRPRRPGSTTSSTSSSASGPRAARPCSRNRRASRANA